VRGVVALDPLQPFQPSPQIPESDESQIRGLLAFEQIGASKNLGYVFPDDAPTWVHPASE